MSWDFATEPEYAEKLAWVDTFVRDEVEPLDLVLGNPYDKSNSTTNAIVVPLQERVRDAGLWAAHLQPEHGGQGYGQVRLALLNELLGRSRWAPSIFGCQAPDSGNGEILARFGTDEQQDRYLTPLLRGEISSCYSMTEPQGGADPELFTASAVNSGSEWVLNGEKWFSSNARYSSFYIVMARTRTDAPAHRAMSMFLVPSDTRGVEIVRNVALGGEPGGGGTHGYVRYTDVRVPLDHLLGSEGDGFAIAQARLGGGRIHHAMRTIAQVHKAFDMMCERAVSRKTRNGTLGSLGVIQEQIADSWIQMEQFRLLVLRTAWLIDQHDDYKRVRKDISAVKVVMPHVLHDVVRRAMHLHGALGLSDEMPFFEMLMDAEVMGMADGPTEVHRSVVARQILHDYEPNPELFPSGHLLARRAAAEERYRALLEHQVAAL